MKLRVLAWLFVFSVATAVVSDRQQRQIKPRHHCECGDICTRVATGEKCKVRGCNGADAR